MRERIVSNTPWVPGVVPVKAIDVLRTPHLVEHVRVNKPVAEGLAVDDGRRAVVEHVKTAGLGAAVAAWKIKERERERERERDTGARDTRSIYLTQYKMDGA